MPEIINGKLVKRGTLREEYTFGIVGKDLHGGDGLIEVGPMNLSCLCDSQFAEQSGPRHGIKLSSTRKWFISGKTR